MPTIGSLIESISQRFEQAALSYGHGTDNAWDEAVALVLGISGAADEQASLALTLTSAQAEACEQAAGLRIDSRQPLAYILGRCTYMGYEFLVRPGVLVPRSPIGYLLWDGLQPWLPHKVERVLDLCCGGGCLGILAAHRFPGAHVTLVDVDEAAVALAADNVRAHDLAQRVQVVQEDVTADLELPHRYDLILANPPYVDAADVRSLPAEYQAEPALALAAGEDGLSIIGPLIEALPRWLSDAGLFVGEVGASAPALHSKYPNWPFVWPELPQGGEGVFLLEAADLSSHTAPDF